MKRITPLVFTCYLLAAAPAAFAQLEEVIVTATKRAESLQDIPVSVTALSETTLQDAGVENIEGVAHLADGGLAHQHQPRAEGFEFGVKKSFHKSSR